MSLVNLYWPIQILVYCIDIVLSNDCPFFITYRFHGFYLWILHIDYFDRFYLVIQLYLVIFGYLSIFVSYRALFSSFYMDFGYLFQFCVFVNVICLFRLVLVFLYSYFYYHSLFILQTLYVTGICCITIFIWFIIGYLQLVILLGALFGYYFFLMALFYCCHCYVFSSNIV